MNGGPELLLALGAGLAMVASPCVLPMLPIVLGASAGRADPRRPLFVIGGFVGSFVVAALAFGASARAFGVDAGTLRQLAAAGLLAAGAMMLWPALADRMLAPLARLAQRPGPTDLPGASGPLGATLLGATLGILWTPCAGPVLGAILALVAGAQATEAAPRLLAFACGAALPMLAIAYGGQAVTTRVRSVARHAGTIRKGFGVLVVTTAIAMLTQQDARIAAALTSWWPTRSNADAADAPLGEAAPDFAGIERWINGPALSMQQLRGRVVLVDFWTFGCVNCLRTLPTLKRLHDRYSELGLTIIGVHTPEFAFERDAKALQDAVQRLDIRYPVAQDNRYLTWNAYGNRYWPAVYLIDREGRIVFRHYGDADQTLVEDWVRKTVGE